MLPQIVLQPWECKNKVEVLGWKVLRLRKVKVSDPAVLGYLAN